MPNGRSHKRYEDYGPHKYAESGTSDCEYGCGCWAGPARSDGPPGIDPFGKCPNNPLDGKRQPGNHDYEDLVNGRIRALESELYQTKEKARLVDEAKKSSKIDLLRRLKEAEAEIERRDLFLEKISEEVEGLSVKISDELESHRSDDEQTAKDLSGDES